MSFSVCVCICVCVYLCVCVFVCACVRVSGVGVDTTATGRPEVVSLHKLYYHVTVVRRVRTVDVAFNWAMAVTSLLNSFSLGSATDCRTLRYQLKHPTAILLTAACQFLLTPPVSKQTRS